MEIVVHFYTGWIEACENKKFSTVLQKISKFFKTKNFSLREITAAEGIPIPIPKSENDYKKLSKFALDLPQLIMKNTLMI